MLGYQNNVLRINLSDEMVQNEPLQMDWARKYIGSKGLAIKYLYEELKPKIDPLSEDNKLIFMTTPLTGTTIPCSGKLSIAGKSPATGTICDCSIGGHAALKIKYAGYDAIILEGKYEKPCYILIEDDQVKILDAEEYWGLGAHVTESLLSERYGHAYSYLTIGPAGETKCGMACINSDYYRQAGRGGMGAVMGSKNVKALVIKGTGSVKIPNIKEACQRIIEIEKDNVLQEDNTYVFDTGTTAFLEACQDGGILPKKNFSDATDDRWTEYNGDVLLKGLEGKRGCGSCGLGCGNFLKLGDVVCEGPEYESIAVAGPNVCNADAIKILKSNKVADDMGLDTISAGDTIAWAMEMTEKGIYDFGIRFGEIDKYIEYLELMARAEGIGAELALGVKKLSEKYGGQDFAMHVKGLEYPQYEPRGSWGMALAYAVSDRGACHMRAYAANEEIFTATAPPYTSEGKGEIVYRMGWWSAVKFSFGICDFWGTITLDMMAEILELVTGEPWTTKQLQEIGVRVLNIARAFNQREGFNGKDDTAPKRIFREVLQSGAGAGQKIPEAAFEDMKQQYYRYMGWNREGMVPEAILAAL